MKRFRWLIFEVVAMSGLLGMSIMLFEAVNKAYRSPSKQVLIDINYYGEAQGEVVIVPIFIAMGIIALIHRVTKGRIDERYTEI